MIIYLYYLKPGNEKSFSGNSQGYYVLKILSYINCLVNDYTRTRHAKKKHRHYVYNWPNAEVTQVIKTTTKNKWLCSQVILNIVITASSFPFTVFHFLLSFPSSLYLRFLLHFSNYSSSLFNLFLLFSSFSFLHSYIFLLYIFGLLLLHFLFNTPYTTCSSSPPHSLISVFLLHSLVLRNSDNYQIFWLQSETEAGGGKISHKKDNVKRERWRKK